jgi:hypothetical protein
MELCSLEVSFIGYTCKRIFITYCTSAILECFVVERREDGTDEDKEQLKGGAGSKGRLRPAI